MADAVYWPNELGALWEQIFSCTDCQRAPKLAGQIAWAQYVPPFPAEAFGVELHRNRGDLESVLERDGEGPTNTGFAIGIDLVIGTASRAVPPVWRLANVDARGLALDNGAVDVFGQDLDVALGQLQLLADAILPAVVEAVDDVLVAEVDVDLCGDQFVDLQPAHQLLTGDAIDAAHKQDLELPGMSCSLSGRLLDVDALGHTA